MKLMPSILSSSQIIQASKCVRVCLVSRSKSVMIGKGSRYLIWGD